MGIRNSAKAIIVQDDKLLAIKMKDEEGDFYILPGGGQEQGENLHEALTRECIEELGEEVEIGELIFVREYIGKNHEHSAFDSDLHQTEYLFLCCLKEEKEKIEGGLTPDDGQIGVEWLPLSKLQQYRLYPQKGRRYLAGYFKGEKHPVYLGDMN